VRLLKKPNEIHECFVERHFKSGVFSTVLAEEKSSEDLDVPRANFGEDTAGGIGPGFG